jgi:chitin synthase
MENITDIDQNSLLTTRHNEFSKLDFKLANNDLLVCITIYNEEAEQLLLSLFSLSQSIEFFLNNVNNARKVTVCIISDGADKVAGSTNKLFQELNLDSNYSCASDMYIGEQSIEIDYIKKLFKEHLATSFFSNKSKSIYWCWKKEQQHTLNKNKANNFEIKKANNNFRIILVNKQQNRGKLDSHWIFFNLIACRLQPKYCFQLDTGTMPGINALVDFNNHFERNEQSGAAASKVLVPSPINPFSILQSWQYTDFLTQKLLDWPAELYSGYLSVLPGQFCGFRWSALNEKNTSSPLDNYFRGLNPISPFESNMFLAEDRILGYEIINQPNKEYTLSYLPHVVAITDSCDNLNELLKQRRSWINSSFFCNLWMIVNSFASFSNKKNKSTFNLRSLFASSWLLLNNLVQWIMPALIFILCLSLIPNTNNDLFIQTSFIKTFSLIAVPIFGGLMLFQLSGMFFRSSEKQKMNIFSACMVLQLIILMLLVIFKFSLNKPNLFQINLLTILIIEFIGVISISILNSGKHLSGILQNFGTYLLLRPVMSLLLSVYSFSNIHDLSWGTKGLKKVQNKNNNAPTKALNFNFVTITIWILSNALVILLFTSATTNHVISNIILIVLCTYFLYKILAGIIFSINSLLKVKKNEKPFVVNCDSCF